MNYSCCDIYDLLQMERSGTDLNGAKIPKEEKIGLRTKIDFLGDFGFKLEQVALQFGIPFESKHVSECVECSKRLHPDRSTYWMGGTFCPQCMRTIDQELNQL